MPPATELADALAGFVAAEGTFTHRSGSRQFTFAVALGASDASTCELLATYLGVGRVRRYRRRQEHFDDEVVFVVRRLVDLVDVVVPWLDGHLRRCHKRTQYEPWRAALLAHWEHEARRRRPCTEVGCTAPSRAKGLCRRHYYAAYGR